jgi:osmotically-inducible protein OsmY
MKHYAFVSSLLLGGIVALAYPGALRGYETGSPNDIAAEVQHVLQKLPFYMVFDHIGFQLNNGTVTLIGQVTRPSLKADMENAVRPLKGVRQVLNEIQVLPDSEGDQKLRLAEYLAIYGDPDLSQYSPLPTPAIHIVVSSAHVTLEGSVLNDADKIEAFTRASSVPGVTSLTNHLQIAPATD